MERIGVLINKLQELYQQNASTEQIIHVAQMLQTELFLLRQQQHAPGRKKIAVMMPGGISVSSTDQLINKADDSKIIDKPQTGDESDVRSDEDAFTQPSKNGSGNKESVAPRGFNVLEEVPTLSHQPQVKELNEVMGRTEPSLNEKLYEQRKELAEKLKEEEDG